MQIYYFVTEHIDYRRSVELPDGLSPDEIQQACKEDWAENGDPDGDIIDVNDLDIWVPSLD